MLFVRRHQVCILLGWRLLVGSETNLRELLFVRLGQFLYLIDGQVVPFYVNLRCRRWDVLPA